MRAVLTTAAVLLVFSSAGFGCVYAYQQALHHGPALAGLAVSMALGLELSKGFAVESVFSCLRRLAIGRALAMLLLAAVAISYSLSAELSLMASTRADVTADRERVADGSTKVKARYDRAAAELAGLAPSRAPAELQALLSGVDCGEATAAKTRATCAELGRATRRGELQAILDKAEGDVAAAPSVGSADAGAAALSALLSMMGLTVPAGDLAVWLVLVGVLALEVGSSLAVVLCRSMNTDGPHRSPPAGATDSRPAVPSTAGEAVHAPQEAPQRAKRTRTAARPGIRAGVADSIVAAAAANGGRVPSSVRTLATSVGAKRTTVHTAIGSLVSAGVLERAAGELVLRG